MNGTNKGVDYGLVTLEIQGPPLMPPGLNSNGRTLAGRRGVAVPPPGSQMFAHMRSLNNGTLAARVPTAGPMASLGRDQMAPPTSVPGGEFFCFFCSPPLVRCLMDGGLGGKRERVRSGDAKRGRSTNTRSPFAASARRSEERRGSSQTL